jgi:hypothetical protein
VLEETRTTTRKREWLEKKGSRAEKLLLEECRQCERRVYVPLSLKQMQRLQSSRDFDYSGFLLPKDVAEVVLKSDVMGGRTLLEAAVLISDAPLQPGTGKIDYYELVPRLVASARAMSDPFIVAQRAEILRVADPAFDISQVDQSTHNTRNDIPADAKAVDYLHI